MEDKFHKGDLKDEPLKYPLTRSPGTCIVMGHVLWLYTKITIKMLMDSYVFRNDECILHEVRPECTRADIVEGIRCLQGLVLWMMHDCRWQCVEAHKVCYHTVILWGKDGMFIKPWYTEHSHPGTLNTPTLVH